MQRIFENAHVCHAVLRGKSNRHIFEEEIQKIKVLDKAVSVQKEDAVQILAYCVLDNELQMLLWAEDAQKTDHFLNHIMEAYGDACRIREEPLQKTVFRKAVVRKITEMSKLEKSILKLHLLPVDRKLVGKPEDYWWSSYPDYLGRHWKHIADVVSMLKTIDENPKCAMRMMRQKHNRAYERVRHRNI